MWSPEVVLDKPLGQVPIEVFRLWREIPELQKLVFERLVEALADGIVLWCLGPGEILGNAELQTGF